MVARNRLIQDSRKTADGMSAGKEYKECNNITKQTNMKNILLTIVMAVGTMTAMTQEEIPAFPGAEGHGRYITGGRGG